VLSLKRIIFPEYFPRVLVAANNTRAKTAGKKILLMIHKRDCAILRESFLRINFD
jgi:hypothetical protein